MTENEQDARRETKLVKELLLRDARLGRLHCLFCIDVWPWDGKQGSCPRCGREVRAEVLSARTETFRQHMSSDAVWVQRFLVIDEKSVKP